MSIVREFEILAGRVLRDYKRVDSLQVVRVVPSPVGPLVEWTGGPIGPRAETVEDGVTFRGGPSGQALLAAISRFLACRWRHGPPVPSPDWDIDLMKRHPRVFQDPPCSHAGWSWLWESGAERIEEAGVPVGFVTQQTKEKFGSARWYHHASVDAPLVDEIIECVEEISAHVCETCGSPGMLRKGAWAKTLCEQHARESGR